MLSGEKEESVFNAETSAGRVNSESRNDGKEEEGRGKK